MSAGLKYIGAAIVIAGLCYFFVFSPQAVQIGRTQAELEEIQAELDDFEQTISELPKFLATQKQLDDFRSSLTSRLYAKQDILELLRQLGIQAEQQGLEIIEITPPVDELIELNNTVPQSGQPEFLNIVLSMRGEFHKFGNFVRTIEKSDYFRGLNKCEITVNDGEEISMDLKIGFKALLGGAAEAS